MNELFSTAAWIIMDPWSDVGMPDTIEHPNLNDHNFKTWIKIKKILPMLKHPIVSSNNHQKIYTELENIKNIGYDKNQLLSYLNTHNLKNIVYCGFHYGICILHRDTGACNINPYFNLNQRWKKEYNKFKGSDWPNLIELDCFTYQDKILKKEIESMSELKEIAYTYIENQKYFDQYKNINVFIKKDLCCIYPGSETQERLLDADSKQYAILI